MDQDTTKSENTLEMVIRTEKCEDIEMVTYLLDEALSNISKGIIKSPNKRTNGLCIPRALLANGGLFAHQILIKFVELKKGVVVSEEYKECPEFKRLQASEANEEAASVDPSSEMAKDEVTPLDMHVVDTSEIVCPYCKYEFEGSGSYGVVQRGAEEENYLQCQNPECKEVFLVNASVRTTHVYTSSKLS